ncbi:MAG: hypothetical protein IID61_10415 [SAR324 cluster bacterium]|nr:hypothetical protein [SAR324 cluster bacterium]
MHRETFASAIGMGTKALQFLGFRAYQAIRADRAFRHHDEAAIRELETLSHDQKLFMTRRVYCVMSWKRSFGRKFKPNPRAETVHGTPCHPALDDRVDGVWVRDTTRQAR